MCGAELPDLPDFEEGDGDKPEVEGRDLKKKKGDSKGSTL